MLHAIVPVVLPIIELLPVGQFLAFPTDAKQHLSQSKDRTIDFFLLIENKPVI